MAPNITKDKEYFSKEQIDRPFSQSKILFLNIQILLLPFRYVLRFKKQ